MAEPSWNHKGLLVCNLLALLLILPWGLGWFEAGYQSLDHSVFRGLNEGLTSDSAWTSLWAYTNTREFDLWAGIGMGLFLVVPGLVFKAGERILRIAEFAAVFFTLQIFRWLYPLIFADRLSPSRAFYPNFQSLHELVPEIPAKIYSEHSFPSDHAAVLFTWSLFVVLASRQPGRWLTVLYALALAMPRLAGGGHWFTDTYIGGLSLALFGLGYGYFTPLRQLARSWAEALQKRWCSYFGKEKLTDR